MSDDIRILNEVARVRDSLRRRAVAASETAKNSSPRIGGVMEGLAAGYGMAADELDDLLGEDTRPRGTVRHD